MPNSYPMRRMTQAELRETLIRLDLTVGNMMFLTGASRLTWKFWLGSPDRDLAEDEVRIPSWLPGYLAALENPDARTKAAVEMFKRSLEKTDQLDIIVSKLKGGRPHGIT